jgi:hypothetical protein
VLIWILASAIVVLLAALGAAVYFLIKIARKIWDLEDQVEESLDILNETHQNVARISEMPVMSDDPTIRDVVANISKAKNAILLVANKIGASFGAEMMEPETSTWDGQYGR